MILQRLSAGRDAKVIAKSNMLKLWFSIVRTFRILHHASQSYSNKSAFTLIQGRTRRRQLTFAADTKPPQSLKILSQQHNKMQVSYKDLHTPSEQDKIRAHIQSTLRFAKLGKCDLSHHSLLVTLYVIRGRYCSHKSSFTTL